MRGFWFGVYSLIRDLVYYLIRDLVYSLTRGVVYSLIRDVCNLWEGKNQRTVKDYWHAFAPKALASGVSSYLCPPELDFFCTLFYSILFYSILFYSILFYSILFYSILF